MKLSSNAENSNDENSFLHKLLLTNTQVSRLGNVFANGSLANIKLSKTRLHKIAQSGGFLGRLLGPLLKTGLPLTAAAAAAAAAAADATIHQKMFGSGMTTLIISNEEINYLMKIVK